MSELTIGQRMLFASWMSVVCMAVVSCWIYDFQINGGLVGLIISVSSLVAFNVAEAMHTDRQGGQ